MDRTKACVAGGSSSNGGSSLGTRPSDISATCSNPGGLDWPPPDLRPFSVEAVKALLLFLFVEAQAVGHIAASLLRSLPFRLSSSLGLGRAVRLLLAEDSGVGHDFAAPVSRGPVRLWASSLASTEAVVGHCRAHVSSDSLPRVAYSSLPSCGQPLLLVPLLLADGVGYSPRDQEDPRAAVRGSDVFGRDWER